MKNGWKTKKLEEITIRVKDGLHKTPEYVSEGVPFVSTTNLNPFSNNFDFSSYKKFISRKSYDELFKSNRPEKGDILISKCGTIGVAQLVRSNFDFGIFVGLALVTLNQEIDGNYFEYYLNSLSSQKEMNNLCTGTTRKTLALQALKKLNVSFPESISEQKRIVSILDKAFADIEKAKVNAEKNLKNSKELFETYSQSVFSNTGKDWEKKTLGEACVVERGSSPRPIEKYITDSEDGVNWIKIGDTKNVEKYIYRTNQKITKKGAEKSRFVNAGDFILSNSMSFGKPYIMKTTGCIHDGWFVLRLPKDIDTEFFWYLLSSSFVMSQFISLSSGAIVKNISGDLVKKTILPIPPLVQQKEIVKKLDNLSEKTKKLEGVYEQKLKDLEELKKSILQKAFNGEL